jgi:NAD(P)-dependent dehydrogenase (short-subunit alcohol dehydrogenase family)
MTARMTVQSAIVTGGASGIGRAAAMRLAADGARILVTDRNADGAAAIASEIAKQGGTAVAMAADIGDSRAVSDVVSRAKHEFGSIDVLVHAAGICPRRPLLDMSDEEWRDVLRVNLDGSFYIARDVGRVMAAQRSGTMILITSDRGVYGTADYGHYAASKGGMIALAKSLALALGKFGVTVNAINPGLTDTPLARAAVTAWEEKRALDVLGSYSQPEEIAETILFLAGTAGKYMTGQVIGTRTRYGA